MYAQYVQCSTEQSAVRLYYHCTFYMACLPPHPLGMALVQPLLWTTCSVLEVRVTSCNAHSPPKVIATRGRQWECNAVS